MKSIGQFINFLLAMVMTGGMLVSLGIASAWFYLDSQLPDAEQLRDVRLQIPLRIYSAEGDMISEYGEKRREPLTREEIPDAMVKAILAVEDSNFYTHPGVDYKGLLRAAVSLIKTGRKKQGGSTITMQLARNFFLSPEKSYKRKFLEILLALRVERELEKDEILTLYLNKVYLGHRSYGITSAAHTYYNKELDELSLAEIAMIAGLPKAPSSNNPLTNPERALKRRNHVLKRMHTLEHISDAVYEAETAKPITASRYTPEIELGAAYIGEMVRAEMVERFGDAAYTGGYHVHTTVKTRLQRAANKALRTALDAYDMRHGYRGPETQIVGWQDANERARQLGRLLAVGNLLPVIVVDIPSEREIVVEHADGSRRTIGWQGLKWASPYVSVNRLGKEPKRAVDIVSLGNLVRIAYVENEKDKQGELRSYWRLAQIPKAQGALVSLDPHTGAVIALAGGYDFFHSKFNRVTQASRQPGSGFKGFIYSAALAAGFQPSSIINDAPVVIEDVTLDSGVWKPSNANRKFTGPTPLRQGLAFSKNLISIRLLRSISIDFALDHVTRFGFDKDKLPDGLALALGSAEVTPLMMARAYSVFANGGFLVNPFQIVRIEQEGVGTIYRAKPLRACEVCPADEQAPRTVSAENRYLIYSMMKDVINMGTGKDAKVLGRKDLAGKTGTTNDYKDAWFNGYNESLVAVAWVGLDNSLTLGRREFGGRAALPAWIDYMRVALDGVPETEPQQPEGIVHNGADFEDVTVEAIFNPEVLDVLDEKPQAEDDLF
ncbi:penicillin-binding protein 1A [Solemya velum gill symbiont]|uniref:penicillin-binding protein 1A n=1 Tax=Solemya velum gill symbiont TaxID=2340 RepID=UPI0009960CEC|nr:penicillin-binding protein 1A [Solemya velum gill symbiont]OOZ45453.1 hypothetical protein BOW38_09735 [Solemya velum gill symbiont]OOZ48339.1 hypothetical protein BOW39_11315 [Solemya velum gill symbiont]OOZ50272.1 hypothetical protein BOW40_10565 [Solemya velum gill symbiont]OOZ53428.1 hypothetical protein BOW41_09930 [Solemya velum gill symbiont]OOZ58576.1 hypothetical protein BOW43_09175 [Solemya velum gill symbiont]